MVEWRTRAKVQAFEPLKIFGFVLFLENILVIALFSFMFTVASFWAALPIGMGFRSIPFWLICLTLFFNYAFIIVDYTSRGMQRIPKLSGDLVFPTHDPRLFTIAGLTLLTLAFVLGGQGDYFDPTRLVVAFFGYPLLFSLLVVNANPMTLLNPVNLFKTLWVFSTSSSSVLFYLLQAGIGTFLYVTFNSFGEISALNLFWQVPISVTLLFILFRSLGVVLNKQGPALGLSVLQNEDTQEQALAEEARIVLDEFVMELHKWNRVHEYKKAFELIRAHQQEHGHATDATLFQRLSQWDDKRLASMLGAQMAEQLLSDGDNSRAYKVFRESLAMCPDKFALSSGTIALAFARNAPDQGSHHAMFEYLQHFEEQFPNHPSTAAALLHLAGIAVDYVGDKPAAKRTLQRLAALEPKSSESAEYQRIRQALA